VEELLNRLTVRQLRSLAGTLDMAGRSGMTKDRLVAAVAETLRAGDHHDRPIPPTAPKPCRHRIGPARWCGLPAVEPGNLCSLHGGTDASDVMVPALGRLGFHTWPALLRHLRAGSYEVDPLGLDPVIAEMGWHLLNYLYRDYFHVEVSGIEHVPTEGPAVLAANHGGAALPYDGLMLPLCVANESPVPRRVRVVGTEILNMLPTISHLYRKAGAAYATPEDALWVLNRGLLLGVFPEGVEGFQKPISEAYQLRRFGRGFTRLAMSVGAPIVPVAIVGSEEVHPALFTSKRLARLVRLLFPEQRVEQMGVWLNPVPLPIRWHVRFLPPVDPGPATDNPDRLTVLEITDRVRSMIQTELDRMLKARHRSSGDHEVGSGL
jgi:1-acyl-sn-glycerol-3-phosphate acyltransferase